MYFALYNTSTGYIPPGSDYVVIDKERKTSKITPKIERYFQKVARFHNIKNYKIISGKTYESMKGA